MRKLLLIILPLLLIVGCSTSQKEKKYYDINNIYLKDKNPKDNIFTFNLKFNNEELNGMVYMSYDDKKVNLGEIKNGKKDGLWTYYYENGIKRVEGTYKDGKPDGIWTFWENNGLDKFEGEKQIIVSLYQNPYDYTEKPILVSMDPILSKIRSYIPSGTGKKDGLWIFWDSYGERIQEKIYRDDVFISSRCRDTCPRLEIE